MKFQGIERIKVPVDDIESGEKKDIEIKYFKSVKSSDRIYHKFQIPGTFPKIDIPTAFEKYTDNFEDISDDGQIKKQNQKDQKSSSSEGSNSSSEKEIESSISIPIDETSNEAIMKDISVLEKGENDYSIGEQVTSFEMLRSQE